MVYKTLDNLGAFQRCLGFQPNTKVATLVFGFFHGFGLATKILDHEISPDGLVPNLLAFNVGASKSVKCWHWARSSSSWATGGGFSAACAAFPMLPSAVVISYNRSIR